MNSGDINISMGGGANCDTVTLNYSTTTQTSTNTLYTAILDPHQTILDSINRWLQNIKIANFRKIQILY